MEFYYKVLNENGEIIGYQTSFFSPLNTNEYFVRINEVEFQEIKTLIDEKQIQEKLKLLGKNSETDE